MEDLHKEIDALYAILAGQTVVISSLIRTHPNYEAYQVDLAGMLEVFLNGPLARTLSEEQRVKAQGYVEVMASLKASESPLSGLQKMLRRD